MAQLDQSFHGICVTKVPVYPQVVFGIVFVIGGGFEDGGEVDRINAQITDVIQMVDHALKVTAEEIERCRLAAPRFHLFRTNIRVAVRESFRENLIEHGILDPCRGCEYSSCMNIRELEHTTRIVRFFFLEVRLGHPDLFISTFEKKRVF
ncbi:hypothetical protein D3C74_350110 [compost metagenome]